MIAPVTLSLYIARQFSLAVVGALLALTGFVALFDFIDLLRRASGHPGVGLVLVGGIALLRLPYLALQVLPFAVQLGGMFAFWRLTRSSELIVARAAGVSAWEFLAAPVLCAALFGAIATAGVSPLSSATFARANQLINRYLSTGGGPLELNGGQLWLRQADDSGAGHGARPGVAILNARGVAVRGGILTGQDVTVFRLDGDGQLVSRIEATSARLADGAWTLASARVMLPDALPTPPRTIDLPTDLTVRRVQESFAPPDTLSVWQLPGFIALLERSGFSSVRDRLHFQALLALPLLTATMALVAAGFSMRPARRGGVARMIGGGVTAGFALFMISKLAEEFGQSGALPVVLAAWAPAAAGLLLAVTLLLHMEDG
ncbi:MAG: LPS export ABC transporter permease LptG [Proteobacteria bacterium]|nr:LPS export ABC transporter permease LptG [Pseudomonadota bacterium]